MVVNGRAELLGSDREKARTLLEHALGERAAISLALNPTIEGRRLTVAYRVSGNLRAATLNLAVTQPAKAVHVENGENAGRTLAHRAVVRAFVSHPLGASLEGSESIELPEAVQPGRATLVGYVADSESLAIHGAASIALGNTEQSKH
jgi:hypothetical protein